METHEGMHARLKLSGLNKEEIKKYRKLFGKYPRGMKRIIWTEDPDTNGQNKKAFLSGWLAPFKKGEACYLATRDNRVQGSTGVGGGFVGFFLEEDSP